LKPKGIRLLFWRLWGWGFSYKLWRKFHELTRKGNYTAATVAKVTTNMLNQEAQKLYDNEAIPDCRVYWKGAWIACTVTKKRPPK